MTQTRDLYKSPRNSYCIYLSTVIIFFLISYIFIILVILKELKSYLSLGTFKNVVPVLVPVWYEYQMKLLKVRGVK